MTDDMRTQILEGTSFMPSQYFYGGEIYGIFRTLVKGFIDIAIQTDIDGIVKISTYLKMKL